MTELLLSLRLSLLPCLTLTLCLSLLFSLGGHLGFVTRRPSLFERREPTEVRSGQMLCRVIRSLLSLIASRHRQWIFGRQFIW